MNDENPDRGMFAELQVRFLAEGHQNCVRLLAQPAELLDTAAVKRCAHEWAGIGGMLGCSEVTVQARLIEQIIAQASPGWRDQLYHALQAMLGLFSDCADYSRSSATDVLS